MLFRVNKSCFYVFALFHSNEMETQLGRQIVLIHHHSTQIGGQLSAFVFDPIRAGTASSNVGVPKFLVLQIELFSR